ncbi:MAG: hypothetical protein ACP5NX_03630 [Candidatus Bilamarchaeaceae archaeon]
MSSLSRGGGLRRACLSPQQEAVRRIGMLVLAETIMVGMAMKAAEEAGRAKQSAVKPVERATAARPKETMEAATRNVVRMEPTLKRAEDTETAPRTAEAKREIMPAMPVQETDGAEIIMFRNPNPVERQAAMATAMPEPAQCIQDAFDPYVAKKRHIENTINRILDKVLKPKFKWRRKWVGLKGEGGREEWWEIWYEWYRHKVVVAGLAPKVMKVAVCVEQKVRKATGKNKAGHPQCQKHREP